MVVALILCSLVVIFIISWFVNYYKYEKYLKKIPGPKPLPLLGNALEFQNLAEILNIFYRLQKEYGSVVKVTIGFQAPILVITDPKLLEFLLGSTKLLEKSADYEVSHNWLGTGLLTSSNEKWKKHRKLLTPTFHFQILEQFIEVFDSFSDIMIEKLRKEVGKDSVDIYRYLTLCSLDIICATAMGTIVNAQENTESEYVNCVKEMCRILMEKSLSITKSNKFLYVFTQDYKTENKAIKILHDYTNSVIASRKKELQNKMDEESTTVDDLGRKKRQTFLDLLLRCNMEGEVISDNEIREEVDTFMFEGHDTTSSAISFILYSLANHPDVQEKVITELDTIFEDDKDRKETLRDLQQMKYLELVIKESLRLYPSVPVFSRNTHEDIEYDGIIIPKNTTLMAFPYGLHRDPQIYPDPERFDPERFAPENQSKRSPYAYIPFSAGPRNCIGQRFAMLEMKSLVSKVLKNYELLPAIPGFKPNLVGETILKSSTGVLIRLKERKS